MEDPLFFEQPYSDRQLIVFVVDAAIITAETTSDVSESNASKEKKPGFWASAAKYVVEARPIEVLLAEVVLKTTYQIINSSKQAKEEGVENLVLVGKSKVPLFQLPPGHPRNRIVYAGHPAIPEVYVPLADFHRLTFEHKFSEVISLLMHLGAKSIKVKHVTGWGTDFSSHLNVGLPSAVPSVDIGVQANKYNKQQQSLLFEAELENSQTPGLPNNLVWYPYESTWQQVANGRLKFGLKNFNLSLNYNDDYGINAGIKLKIDKVGLDAGGSFEQYIATTWQIYGNF